MQVIAVNVGLAIPGSNLTMEPGPVLAVLKAHFAILDSAVVQSDSEPTVSAVLGCYCGVGDALRRLNLVAISLGQEAIAVYVEASTSALWREWGTLVGPNAAAWGDFNPEFFLTTGGARLSDILRELP
jgi:hypothetical protein